MNELDNIEKIIKQKLENHAADVKPELWQNIKTKLPQVSTAPAHIAMASKALAVKIIAAVAVITGITVAGYFALNQNNNTTKNSTALVENTNIVTEKVQENQINKVEKVAASNLIEPKKEKAQNTGLNPKTKSNQSALPKNPVQTNQIEQSKANQPIIPNTPQSTIPENKNPTAAPNPQSKLPVQAAKAQPLKTQQQPENIQIVISKFADYQGYSIIYSCKTNAQNVSWNFGDGSPDMNQNKGTHDFAQAGTYTITATIYDKNGKPVNQASKQITFEEKAAILFVPNIITPNGDGINDVFKIKVLNIQSISVKIFQSGKIVFDSENANPDELWNGKDMSGNLLPSGQYQYAIYAIGKNGKALNPKVGNIFVRR